MPNKLNKTKVSIWKNIMDIRDHIQKDFKMEKLSYFFPMIITGDGNFVSICTDLFIIFYGTKSKKKILSFYIKTADEDGKKESDNARVAINELDKTIQKMIKKNERKNKA
mgnify:CR=1 FL=1|jgi:hypothetical protein